MARPISWLPRLHLIRHRVANSPRSHYGRRDIERLFELQPRAAQKLIEMMGSVGVGTSRLVEREVLLSFLEIARDADSPSLALSRARSTRLSPAKRSLHEMVPHDHAPASWETLPEGLWLKQGEVRVTFTRVEELASALAALASLLDRELEAFADRYEVQPVAGLEEERHEVERMFEELAALEARR